MINPEELMIGNWVYLDKTFYGFYKGSVYQVERVGEIIDSWQDMGASDTLRHTDISPIPLTEEWLERFGFTYDSVSWEKGSWLIGNFKNGYYFLLDGKINGRRMLIEYVHELQNLYFWIMRSKLKENHETQGV